MPSDERDATGAAPAPGAEAEARWRAALAERPASAPVLLGLAELFLAQGRWDELDEVLRRLESGAAGGELEQAYRRLEAGLEGPQAGVLRARGHLACKRFAAARQLLDEIVAGAPQALWPRLLLSRALMQEGRDPAATERALRDVLALDPGHGEARHNLVLLRGAGPRVGAAPGSGPTLADLYRAACATPSDIHEHLPTLYALARLCRHVTEMGTRAGVSTTALLFAQPERLVCYDRMKYRQVDALRALAGRTDFVFHEADVLRVEIEETDLLFLDTWHVYDQLREELRLHAGKVRRYVALHDTTAFGERGEAEGHAGLWPAVEEFLARGTFRLKERYTNNNGLTVLEALSSRGGHP